MKRALVLAVLCACAEQATSIQLSIVTPPATTLDGLALVVGKTRETRALTNELTLFVPDEWASTPVHVGLEGLYRSTAVAYGGVDVVPVLGERTNASVQLELTELTPTCDACPSDKPICRDGVCVALDPMCQPCAITELPYLSDAAIYKMQGDATHLYWAATNGVTRWSEADGIEMLAAHPQTGDMALTDDDVFWIEGASEIKRRSKSLLGGQLVLTGASGTIAVAADDSHVYWIDNNTHELWRRTLALGPGQNLATVDIGSHFVIVDDTHVYWISWPNTSSYARDVYRVPKGGGTPELLIDDETICSMTLDATHLYVMALGVFRLPKAGGAREVIAPNASGYALAGDATHIMWVDDGSVRIRHKSGGAIRAIGAGVDDNALLGLDPDWLAWTAGSEKKVVVAQRCSCTL